MLTKFTMWLPLGKVKGNETWENKRDFKFVYNILFLLFVEKVPEAKMTSQKNLWLVDMEIYVLYSLYFSKYLKCFQIKNVFL